MKVLKFGGTSLGNASRMQKVAEIVSHQQLVVVVLSAISGTTNSLVDITAAIKSGEILTALAIIEKLSQRDIDFISQLFTTKSAK